MTITLASDWPMNNNPSPQTRQCCFTLLGELVNVLPGCLAPYTEILLPAVHTSIRYKTTFFLLFFLR